MNLHPIAKKILDEYAKLDLPPVPSLTPANARQAPSLKYAVENMQADHAAMRLMNVAKPAQSSVEKVAHITIPGPGGDLLARVYTPSSDASLPVIVYFHGGGWVFATLDTYDSSCRSLANASGMIVVSVAYRQAPENKFPAASDDAYAAYRWVRDNAATFGGDPKWVAVAGESAGGNLATVTCLQARDKGTVLPDFQLLVYPVTSHRSDTPSMRECTDTAPLNSAMMSWFWKHYLTSEADGSNPYASPLKAPSLSGLPPAHVITAGFDPLRDEGERYADRLAEAGVSVSRVRCDDLMHEFFGLAAAIPEAQAAVDQAGRALKDAWHEVVAPAR